MKKIGIYTAVFIFALMLSLIVNFPSESLFEYAIWQLEGQSGVEITYKDSEFNFNRAKLNEVEIIKNGKVLQNIDTVNLSMGLNSARIKAKKDDGNLTTRVSKNKTTLKMENYPLITNGKELFKNVGLTGSFVYEPERKRGTGKISANLQNPMPPLPISTDIQAEGNIIIDERSANIDIENIAGDNLLGEGNIIITFNPRVFNNSTLSGSLKLESNNMPLNLIVKGTLADPDVKI